MVTTICIKWGKQKFDVDFEDTTTGIELKSIIYSLTQVNPDKQKIMVKGGMLKDDTMMATLGLKPAQVVMMMGTVDPLVEPQVKPVFLEDMTDQQISQALKIPSGLVNLGNTCYLNSTLQCLKAIPELSIAIKKSGLTISSDSMTNFAVSMDSLYEELSSAGRPVQPLIFVQVLRTLFPQFSEQDRNGFMQQDAEECWGQIIHALSQKVSGLTSTGEIDPSLKFVDQFMTTEFLVETKCDDVPSEEPTMSFESTNKIRVNIGAGVSTYMITEIGNGLVEKIEKNSPTTGSLVTYTKTSKISRLPQYLTINFVRFQWKPTERIKAKILKRVQFPHELDMVSFCTPDLIRKLEPAKTRLKHLAEKAAENKKLKIVVPKEKSTKSQRDILNELKVDQSLVSDPGANPSGQYDLVSVLTHVGRGANSGHYIGWVKDENCWWKFDDDKVTQITEEDIIKLEGGGDYHTAYLALYKSKPLE